MSVVRIHHDFLQSPKGYVHPADARAVEASVAINESKIGSLLPWLRPGSSNTAWQSYVSPLDPVEPDLARLFYELALTIAQFGGFIAYRPDGSVITWKEQGSGVKAILSTVAAIRTHRKLPQIDIRSDLDRELAPFFIRTPFGRERLEIMLEVGNPRSPKFFANMLNLARRRDGSFVFNVLHMRGLACRYPNAFGDDPRFFKKASLLLMTMEIALNQLGFKAFADTPPPADYRIPQILEGLGILRLSRRMREKIEDGHVFHHDDPHVEVIRAATVRAVRLIRSAWEAENGKPISCAELDSMLYHLSRNRALMGQCVKRPHMLVATPSF